jgi:histidine triad (HIT) family protein
MADCIFCRIVRGEVPARKVYEDEHAVAFLDAFPLAKGHTLVVPRQHVARVEDLGDQQAKAVFAAVHKLTGRVTRAAGAQATTIAINNGKEAGQEVPHLHVHVVPRVAGDQAGPIHALAWERPKPTPEDLDRLATSIRALP